MRRVPLVLRARRVNRVFRVLPARQAQPVPLELLDRLVLQVLLDPSVRRARRVNRVFRVPPARQAQPVPREP